MPPSSGSTLDERVAEPDSKDEVAELVGLMNQMLDRLEAASERQSAFVADASHELKSPLSTVVAAGIPEAVRERVFERFVRLDDSRGRAPGGTGIGLALVKAIVGRHDGTVEIGASAGLGRARIRIELPRGTELSTADRLRATRTVSPTADGQPKMRAGRSALAVV